MNHYPIHPDHPLILASGSPRRRRLLTQLDLPFRVITSDVSEHMPEGDTAKEVCRLAERKAANVYDRESRHSWVLGADTVVVAEGEILGKPEDREDAGRMLRMLSGREHEVVTGFCVLDPAGARAHREAVSTAVRVKKLSATEIAGYIATGEPFGKAGAYAIQGIGSFMVEAIRGSYTNVVGLPLCALVKGLVSAGALRGFPQPLPKDL